MQGQCGFLEQNSSPFGLIWMADAQSHLVATRDKSSSDAVEALLSASFSNPSLRSASFFFPFFGGGGRELPESFYAPLATGSGAVRWPDSKFTPHAQSGHLHIG
jgi:hypothetical protein